MNFSKRLLNGEWNLQLINFKSNTAVERKGEIPIPELKNESSLKVTVPGEVHMDLFKNNLIPDLYIGEKELKFRWIADSDWKYSREFKISKKEIEDNLNIDLICDGIDTIADIFINGIKLEQRVENMFRVYRFKDVKKLLKIPEENEDESINEIEIIIYSPSKYCFDKAKSYKYVIPEWEYPNGIQHRNFIRKCGCHFGWDWGPCFCPLGIYKDISLEFYSIPLIKEVIIHQNHKDYNVYGTVEIDIELKLFSSSISNFKTNSNLSNFQLPIQVDINQRGSESIISKTFIINNEQLLSDSKHPLIIVINDAKLWWPLGHGEQYLYDINISIPNLNNNESSTTTTLYEIKKTIGLRTAKVDVSKDIHGRRFQMIVNGVAIFAKGADWIPADHFLTRIPNERIYHLLKSAVLANMNCIRVWGGGIYESNYFYELCDQFGIMLWQDLMFGCALYPTDKAFLKNVKKEVKCQINRIGHHCSIILWCGSNESEQALVDKVWEPIKENSQRYTVDFNKLYIDSIMKILRKKLPEVFYWVSSPSNGVHEWGDSNDQTRGDTHYWGVWHSDKPFTEYLRVKSRFLSEFGFQSLPSFSELKKVLSSADQLNITSPEMEGRQRSPIPGNTGILKHVALHFRVPLDFHLLCYTSQMLQAFSIKTGCEHWRRMKPYCMGTLYWQLNDIWVGPSWSSIEYNGNWKALHYFAKKFYQPILLSFAEDLDEPNLLEVWFSHDYDNLENIYLQSKLFVYVWDLRQSKIVNTLETIVSVVLSDKHQCSKKVFQTSKDRLFSSLPLPPNNYIVTAHLDCSKNVLKSNNQTLCSKFSSENYNDISNTFYPTEFKKLNLKPTLIKLVGEDIDIIVNKEENCFEFTIESTESIALMVWIDCKNYSRGYYSDNGFNLFKNSPKKVYYYPSEFNPSILPIFDFTSLRDTY